MGGTAVVGEQADLVIALKLTGGENALAVANNPKLVKAVFDVLKGVAKNDVVAATAAAASGTNAVVKKGTYSSATKDVVRATSFTLSQAKLSLDLTTLKTVGMVGTKLTPAGAFVLIGAVTVQKTGLALSLVGSNEEKARCIGAVMELAGVTAATAVTLPLTAPTGVIFWLSLASVGASVWNAHASCKGWAYGSSGGGSTTSGPASAATPAPAAQSSAPVAVALP